MSDVNLIIQFTTINYTTKVSMNYAFTGDSTGFDSSVAEVLHDMGVSSSLTRPLLNRVREDDDEDVENRNKHA